MNPIAACPKSLRPALLCLRISEGLYIFLAILFGVLGPISLFGPPLDPGNPNEQMIIWGFVFLFVFLSLGMAIFIEIVCRHLKQGKYWAWIAALILCGLYVPSLFIVLGIVGLLSLLKPETRAFFGQK